MSFLMEIAMSLVTWLRQHENLRFDWSPATGVTRLAAVIMIEGSIPADVRAGGIACFEVPLLAAGRLKMISAADVAHRSTEAASTPKNGNVPVTWAPRGLKRFYYGPWLRHIMFLGGWPQRGDVVYFWAAGAGYFAHVAVATGNGSEVISLGHYETGRDDTDRSRTLEALTIEEIVDRHARHRPQRPPFSAVYYGAGPW
jgi:hypothetical protein